jgi:hypothetical protein
MNEFLAFFTSTETPFALLFIALFFYFIKTYKDREDKYQTIINENLKSIREDLNILINVWKILLEQELERRNKK